MHQIIKSHERIIERFIAHAQVASPDEISRGKCRYHFTLDGTQRIFFILEGDFLLKLQSENKMLSILSAPFVMGVSPSMDAPPLYLERVGHGKVSYIDYNFFWQNIPGDDLFSDVMSVISAQYSELIGYIMLNKNNSYDQVISLIEHWQKIPAHLKKRFSVLYLIEHSSYLSKSSISRVLKALKDSGKLTLERGRFNQADAFKRQ